MALSDRLRTLALPHIYNYLDPDGSLRKLEKTREPQKPVEFDVQTSSQSRGISRIYAEHKALTFFVRDKNIEEALRPHHCMNREVRFAHSDEEDHAQFHKSLKDNTDHVHFLKNHYFHTEISQSDLECIIDGIKQYESEKGLCKNSDSNCILTNEDANKIVQNYNRYQAYFSNIHTAAEDVFNYLANKCVHAGKNFANAFLETFFNRYILPFLIQTRRLNYTQQQLLKETFNVIVLTTLSGSILRPVLSKICYKAINMLLQDDLTVNLMETIQIQIETAFALTTNPFSLLDLGINGSSATLGQVAAHALIREKLTKLKIEPKDENAKRNLSAKKTSELPEGLRRRRRLK